MDSVRVTSSQHDSATVPDSLADLVASIRGRIVAPGEPGWDAARQAWNLAVDLRPALVAMPLDLDDVRAIVRYARHHRLRIAPQGTGHSAGALGSLADTILLSTRHMRGVEIDATKRIARVQAGTLWLEVTEATSPFGLYPLSGSSPDIGVVAYTLGGGLSWLARQHGLAANQVTAIEVVTAEGEVTRATPSEHTDLFWALRGGGGSFGVVTALEFTLFPYAEVYAGMSLWPYERHLEILPRGTRGPVGTRRGDHRVAHHALPAARRPATSSCRPIHGRGRRRLRGRRRCWPHDGGGPARARARARHVGSGIAGRTQPPSYGSRVADPVRRRFGTSRRDRRRRARRDCSCSAAPVDARGTAPPRRRAVTCRGRRGCARFAAWGVRDLGRRCRRRFERGDRSSARTAPRGDSCLRNRRALPQFHRAPGPNSPHASSPKPTTPACSASA